MGNVGWNDKNIAFTHFVFAVANHGSNPAGMEHHGLFVRMIVMRR